MALQIVPATEHHLGGVTEIYNDVIARTTAVYSSLEAALSANLYRDLRPGVAETFE